MLLQLSNALLLTLLTLVLLTSQRTEQATIGIGTSSQEVSCLLLLLHNDATVQRP